MENCARGDVADGATGGAANYFSQRLAPELSGMRGCLQLTVTEEVRVYGDGGNDGRW